MSSRRTLAAVALLAAIAALASVTVVSLNGAGRVVSLVALNSNQAHVAEEALAWFKKEHPHTAAIIGDAGLAKEAAQTTAETVTVKPAAAATQKHWYSGAAALSSAEWDRLQGSILQANAMTLAKVAGELQALVQQKDSPSVDAKLYEKPGQFVAALERLRLLPMSKDAASRQKCDDHEDCLNADLYSRFLKASEQGTGCPSGSKCELHQLWLTCGGKQGVCPVYLYARPSEARLHALHVQQLQAAYKSAPSIVLDEPKYPPMSAKELHMATRRPSVEASSEPSKYNEIAWAKGEFDTGAHSKENTETYDHLKVRELKAGGKLPNGEVHGPSGKWATRLPSDDNKNARTWYPTRIIAEQGREEADGKQEAGTLRWKKKIVYAKGYPEQDGMHYLGGYEDARTDTHKLADSISGNGLKGVNVYTTPLDDDPNMKRSKSYKDTVRRTDRSLPIVDAGSAGVHEVAKTLDGAKEFVYGPGNTEKGHVPGVQVNNDLMGGVPNPFGEIMKGGAAREQQLTQVDAPAHTEELNGLSSLLTRRKSDGLTAQQQAVLRDNSKQLLSEFFGNGAKTAEKTSARAEPAMAAAAERISNERGGLLSTAEDENEGVESPAVKRAAKMRADAARVVLERADAREMREKGEQRRAMKAKRKARDLALKLDGSMPVTEEGALLAKSELLYVHKLEHKLVGTMHHKESAFARTEHLQREEERRMLLSNGRRPVIHQVRIPRASRGRKSSQVAADSAVRMEEARLEKQAFDNAAKETGMPRETLQRNVRARLSAASAASTNDELKREEVRLEHQAVESAAKEIGVSRNALASNVRARLSATSSKVRASRRAAAATPLNINMLGAHRKVGPRDAGTVAQGELESMDQLIFGNPTTSVGKPKKALLPGVHLWGLSSSPDLNNAAKEAWKDDLKEMHLSHQHTEANLRDGIWSGEEAASMKSARLQQLALPSSVLGSSFWPSGHAADERVRKSSLVSSGGADDWSEGGVLHANSVDSDTKFAKGSWRDDVSAPCDSNDAGLCADAHAQPRVEIGGEPKASMKIAAVQQLSEQEHVQLRAAQHRSAQQRSETGRDEVMSGDQSVSSMMLAAMGKNPEPYEERRLARKAPAVLQMMKGVWAGEGNVGAEWHKCSDGAINCPPAEMGGYAAEEPYNHISGEYAPPRWPADPVRAHYGKRLGASADARDYYNDDIVTPMRHNLIDEPEHPDPNFPVVDYKPHPAFDPENETEVENYPNLVRWDKEKWKEAADADEERAHEGDDHGEDDDDDEPSDDEQDEPSPEDVKEEEEEEEDETGLRPGTLTMKPGRHPRGVTWEGIARKRFNDTFSGREEEDGSHPWNVSPLDDRDDQKASDFEEFEPQHMHMKSLDGRS